MLANEVRHQSTISRDHKKLNLIISLIQSKGLSGIKRGDLILKSGIPFAQWQFYHQILIDLEDIEWTKVERTYTSLVDTEKGK